jgi:DNA-directed RNA polymerase specialized sigma24 family protein
MPKRCADALHELRDDRLDFAVFVCEHRDYVTRWVAWIHNRWGYTTHAIDDLIQIAFTTIWNAVKSWDPTHPRASSLDKYVYYQVGRDVAREIARSQRWPTKNKKPVIEVPNLSVTSEVGRGDSSSWGEMHVEAGALHMDEAVLRGHVRAEASLAELAPEDRALVVLFVEGLRRGYTQAEISRLVETMPEQFGEFTARRARRRFIAWRRSVSRTACPQRRPTRKVHVGGMAEMATKKVTTRRPTRKRPVVNCEVVSSNSEPVVGRRPQLPGVGWRSIFCDEVKRAMRAGSRATVVMRHPGGEVRVMRIRTRSAPRSQLQFGFVTEAA